MARPAVPPKAQDTIECIGAFMMQIANVYPPEDTFTREGEHNFVWNSGQVLMITCTEWSPDRDGSARFTVIIDHARQGKYGLAIDLPAPMEGYETEVFSALKDRLASKCQGEIVGDPYVMKKYSVRVVEEVDTK